MNYTVNAINATLFSNNNNISHVDCSNLPWVDNSMNHAFYMCKNLESVTNISNSITNMNHAFYMCNILTEIPPLPDSVTDISYAFSQCKLIVNGPETIPNSVTNLCYAFSGCTNLNIQTIKNLPIGEDIDFTGFVGTNAGNVMQLNLTPLRSYNGLFCSCLDLLTTNGITIYDNVKTMKGTFMRCWNLAYASSLSIPNSVTTMAHCFEQCNRLVDINFVIPDSVTNLANCFTNCRNAPSLPFLPNNAMNVSAAYYFCNAMTQTPSIPNTVTDITNLFYGCENITNPPVIPNHITNIYGLFYYCYRMTSAPTIPTNVTDMHGAFSGCCNIPVAPTIPNGVLDLDNAFWDCIRLTTLPTVPDSVVTMKSTFGDCYNITSATQPLPPFVTDISGLFTRCYNMRTCFDEIPQSVINMRVTFTDCRNLVTNNFIIHSTEIVNAYNCFYNTNTSTNKNVYIPFTYNNGEYTKTYNSFTEAGYTTDGTSNRVYLKDLCTLTIVPMQSDVTVTFSGTGIKKGNAFNVEKGTSVTYTVSKAGYTTKSETLLVNKTETKAVFLECNPGDTIFESSTPGIYEIEIQTPGLYEVTCVGGGASGTAGYAYFKKSGKNYYSAMARSVAGGGSGGYSVSTLILESNTYEITVGSGGSIAGTTNSIDTGELTCVGNPGADSSFSSYLVATGGQGGEVWVKATVSGGNPVSGASAVGGQMGIGTTANGITGGTKKGNEDPKVVDLDTATIQCTGGASKYNGYGKGGGAVSSKATPVSSEAGTNGYVKVVYIQPLTE